MVCGEAEKICSNLRHHVQSFSVSIRSGGSGSITGRGAGWYWPCGWAAQPVIASAHTALSSFQRFSMFLLLSYVVGVLLEQAGPQA